MRFHVSNGNGETILINMTQRLNILYRIRLRVSIYALISVYLNINYLKLIKILNML